MDDSGKRAIEMYALCRQLANRKQFYN